MDEKRLAEIDEWATDHVPRCYGCDGIARVIVPGTSRPMCAACAPNVPGAVLPLVSVYATTLDLAAQVRRLTAALDAARREGAEGMREAAVAMIGRRITAWDDDADECGDEDAATRWEEATAIRDAIRALPLAAPGGGS